MHTLRSRRSLQAIEEYEALVVRIWFRDETHFYLYDHVNKKSYSLGLCKAK